MGFSTFSCMRPSTLISLKIIWIECNTFCFQQIRGGEEGSLAQCHTFQWEGLLTDRHDLSLIALYFISWWAIGKKRGGDSVDHCHYTPTSAFNTVKSQRFKTPKVSGCAFPSKQFRSVGSLNLVKASICRTCCEMKCYFQNHKRKL